MAKRKKRFGLAASEHVRLAKEIGHEAEQFFKKARAAADRGDCYSAWDNLLVALSHEGRHKAHRYSAPKTETGLILNKEVHFAQEKALSAFHNVCLVRKGGR